MTIQTSPISRLNARSHGAFRFRSFEKLSTETVETTSAGSSSKAWLLNLCTTRRLTLRSRGSVSSQKTVVPAAPMGSSPKRSNDVVERLVPFWPTGSANERQMRERSSLKVHYLGTH